MCVCVGGGEWWCVCVWGLRVSGGLCAGGGVRGGVVVWGVREWGGCVRG